MTWDVRAGIQLQAKERVNGQEIIFLGIIMRDFCVFCKEQHLGGEKKNQIAGVIPSIEEQKKDSPSQK
jgi:hypothetical protein